MENFWISEDIFKNFISNSINYGRNIKYKDDLLEGTEVVVSNDGFEFFKRYYSGYGYCYSDINNPYKTDSWNYVFEFDKIKHMLLI